MDAVSNASIFQWVVGLAGFGLLFILNTLRADIKSAKQAAEDAAVKAGKDLNQAKAEIVLEIEQTVSSVRAVADEGKRLAVQSLDRLTQHELHVARNHPTNSAIDKLEAQIERLGDTITEQLSALGRKMDGKVDKKAGSD